jgi:hypothetical protein
MLSEGNKQKGRAVSDPASSLLKLHIDFLLSYKVGIDSPLISTSRKNISVRLKFLPKYFPPPIHNRFFSYACWILSPFWK